LSLTNPPTKNISAFGYKDILLKICSSLGPCDVARSCFSLKCRCYGDIGLQLKIHLSLLFFLMVRTLSSWPSTHFFYLFIYLYYSYVHTMLGSFLPPAATPSLTTYPAPSLSPPPPPLPPTLHPPSPHHPLDTRQKLFCPYL
jgi:hypothetical protein